MRMLIEEDTLAAGLILVLAVMGCSSYNETVLDEQMALGPPDPAVFLSGWQILLICFLVELVAFPLYLGYLRLADWRAARARSIANHFRSLP